jgi:hypothetical protein
MNPISSSSQKRNGGAMTSQHGLYNQFTFEKSGLPDHPTIRAAYGLMLKCEIEDSPIHYKEACIQRDIRRANAVVANGWSSDPDVIAAALLRGAYENAETLKDSIHGLMSRRVMDLVLETSRSDAGEDDPRRRDWSPDAKAIVYADCVEALTRWNGSLSKSFADIAARNQGQIVDPQYLGTYETLVDAAVFIRQDLGTSTVSNPALAVSAVSGALDGAGPVTQSIRKQALVLASSR